MGLFGPSRQERHAAAAAAIAPYGFSIVPGAETTLREYLPFSLHSTPARYHAAATGRIDGTDVWAFEYGYDTTDSEGQTQSCSQLVVVAHHPRIRGGAAFGPDPKQWSAVAQVLDVLFWVPPFTFLKVVQWIGEAQSPDRIVGDPTFDRLYRVRAASDADAARAIPPRLRETVVRLGFEGIVELRESVLVYSVRGTSFDAAGLVRALGYAAPLVVSAAEEPPAAYR